MELTDRSAPYLILRYADDTNLLVPQCSDTSILDEFEAIRNWTRLNKMQLNVKKTKELVFHRPNPRFSLPDPLPHIECVNGLKLLGVFLNANFKFDEHVNKMLCLCSQRMYLLKQLKSQVLGIKQLHIVFTALIVSSFTCTLRSPCPGWLLEFRPPQ